VLSSTQTSSVLIKWFKTTAVNLERRNNRLQEEQTLALAYQILHNSDLSLNINIFILKTQQIQSQHIQSVNTSEKKYDDNDTVKY